MKCKTLLSRDTATACIILDNIRENEYQTCEFPSFIQ